MHSMEHRNSAPRKILTYNLSFRNVGREISDADWESIEPIHIELWQRVQDLYEFFEVDFKGYKYQLKFDFSFAIEDLSHRYNVMRRLVIDGDKSAINDFKHQETDVRIIATTNDSARRFDQSDDLIEFNVYIIFIAMNLASPGSCDFDGGYIVRCPADLNIFGKEIRRDISLSAHMFEAALYEKEATPWLELKTSASLKPFEWLQAVCPQFHIIPENAVARCVYALMYLSRDHVSPSGITWVFYGLESLFQCRHGENFATLVRRIANLLNLSKPEEKSMKSEMRKLYDARSSFIHGGMNVVHPMRNEVLDRRADDAAWQTVQLITFGVALIIKCLQKMIEDNAVDLKFVEHVESIVVEATPPQPAPRPSPGAAA
jgi:hypothetical protein